MKSDMFDPLRVTIRKYGIMRLCRDSGVSRSIIQKFLVNSEINTGTLKKICQAMNIELKLRSEHGE